MRSRLFISILTLLLTTAAFAEDPAPAQPPQDPAQNSTSAVTAEASRLSEDLIYSVDRTPERTFDTARAVQVITEEQIRRSNAQTLEELLAQQPGFAVANQSNGTMPILRGLGGKQVMFLIDGVRVNNATWRGTTREYLNIFGLSQIERIEIVRGVVSVLGTESLGGVVNIITKKASSRDASFGGTATGMYATAAGMASGSISTFGSVGPVRYTAGTYRTKNGNIAGGDGMDNQPNTAAKQQGAFINGQWLISRDKTVSFGYQYGTASSNIPAMVAVVGGKNDPTELRLASVSYQDLVSRTLEDSLKVTLFSNHQADIHDVDIRVFHFDERNRDKLNGLNLEFGKFVGSQHFVYGADYSSERIESTMSYVYPTKVVHVRGDMLDGAEYKTASVYLQDRFDLGQWLTVVGGARASRFEASGQEVQRGVLSVLDSKRANATGALNIIGHVTPRLNVIANAVRGYRAPNLEELTWSAPRAGVTRLPALDARPEKVLSLEGGVKYDGSRFTASAFYYRNRFTDYLIEAPALVNGLPFADSNGNGIKDPMESALVRLQNVGEATIEGVDASFGIDLPMNLHLAGNYSRLIGTDETTGGPLNLMPPANGLIAVRWLSPSAYRPWAEIEGRFAQAQNRLGAADVVNPYIGPHGVPGYQVLDLRGGLTFANRLGVTLGIENAFDEKYRVIGADRYSPGRQFVIGTQVQF